MYTVTLTKFAIMCMSRILCHRYVEAVTPTLSKLHPSALIDGLHSQCLDRLKQQNKLKKLGEGDESVGSPTSSAQRHESVSGEEGLDVAKTSSLQALFTLPRVSCGFGSWLNVASFTWLNVALFTRLNVAAFTWLNVALFRLPRVRCGFGSWLVMALFTLP